MYSLITKKTEKFHSTSVYPNDSDKHASTSFYLVCQVWCKRKHANDWNMQNLSVSLTLDGLSKNRWPLMVFSWSFHFTLHPWMAEKNTGLPYTTRTKIACCALNPEYKNIQFCEDICYKQNSHRVKQLSWEGNLRFMLWIKLRKTSLKIFEFKYLTVIARVILIVTSCTKV